MQFLRIDSVKRVQGKAILRLSNGEMIDMPRAMLKERPYRSGMPFDLQAHRAFITARSYAFALDKAIALLASRNRTEHEIVSSLRRNAYPEETISRVLSRLVDAGYIDDASFAENWMNTRISKGMGPRRIQMELRQKGIHSDHISDALDTAQSDLLFESALKAAQKSARGKDLNSPADRQKVFAALARRGFDFSTAKRALQQLQSEE